ncbi:hypothetical protein [Streptomyces sp. NPDC048312]|uniref:hypothetical protein n=1 Tax=unclassified Streptomyces TaxID=2593676 RepID=UPI0033EE5875
MGEEREVFDAFLRDGSVPADDSEFWGGWLPLVERTVAARTSSRPSSHGPARTRWPNAITSRSPSN